MMYIAAISLKSKAIFHIYFVAILNCKWVSTGVWFLTPCYQKGYIEFIAISSNQNLLGIKLLARKIFKCLYSPKFGKISDT